MLRYWVALAILLTGGLANAQLQEGDTMRFQLRAGLSGAWQGGNVELLIIRGRYELVSNGKKALVFKSQGNSLYQSFGGWKADNDLYSRNFLYWQPQRKMYPFAVCFIQTNYRRNIGYRWFAGTGASWRLAQTPTTSLKLSANLVREGTQFYTNQFNEDFYNGQTHIDLWRATLYASGWHRLIQSRLFVFYTIYWQPAIEPVPNNRLQAELGLEFPLRKRLSFRVEYWYAFEQVVAEQVQQTDRLLTFGVQYQVTKQ